MHQLYPSNVYIGSQSGLLNESRANNVFVGTDAGYHETGSSRLYIESDRSFQDDNMTPLIYGEFDNDLVRINGTLNVTDTLHISETAKLTPLDVTPGSMDEPTCDAANKGLLYMNDQTSKLRLCDGSSWVDLN